MVPLRSLLPVSRLVPFLTLQQSDVSGPRQRHRLVLSPTTLAEWGGDGAPAAAVDWARNTVLGVSAGRACARGTVLRIRSILLVTPPGRPSRALVHVEERHVGGPFASARGSHHVVVCEALPEDLTFVDCGPLEPPRRRPHQPVRVVPPG